MHVSNPSSSQPSLQLQEGIPAKPIPRKHYLAGLFFSAIMWITLPCLLLPREVLQTVLGPYGRNVAEIAPVLIVPVAVLYLDA